MGHWYFNMRVEKGRIVDREHTGNRGAKRIVRVDHERGREQEESSDGM